MSSSREQAANKGVNARDSEVVEIIEDPPSRDDSTSDSSFDSDDSSPTRHSKSRHANEIGHGPFSSCTCKACMKSAKIEVEKRFSDETLTTTYIKKLENLVESLQKFKVDDYEFGTGESLNGGCNIFPPSPPPPASFGPGFKPVKEKSRPRQKFQDEHSVKDEKGTGARVEIKRQRKIHQTYGEVKVEPDFGNIVAGDDLVVVAKNESVLTVTREYDIKKNFWRKTIEILSPDFVQTLNEVAPYPIELPPLTDGFLRLAEPLMPLFWSRKYLTEFVEKGSITDPEKNKQAKTHTKLILDWMRDENVEISKKADDIESADPSGIIEFPDLWMLYAPGTVVFGKEEGEWEALVVDSVRGSQKSVRRRSGQHDHTRLDLTCWAIDYDGEVFGRVWKTHCLEGFQGKKEITSLNLVPEKFLPGCESIKENLRARGRAFWALRGQNYKEYTGEMYSQRLTEGATRVIVDHLTYQRREDWPIVINAKKGPSSAVSKNWRDDRFSRSIDNRQARDRQGRYYNEWGQPIRPRAPPPIIVDVRGSYTPEGDYFDPPPPADELPPYHVYQADRPPPTEQAPFNHYDVIKPEDTPDDFALMLCPQQVHGFCLRDKVWSKCLLSSPRST